MVGTLIRPSLLVKVSGGSTHLLHAGSKELTSSIVNGEDMAQKVSI
jgi:hypothetical protein